MPVWQAKSHQIKAVESASSLQEAQAAIEEYKVVWIGHN